MAAIANFYSDINNPEKCLEYWELAMNSTHKLDGPILLTRNLIDSKKFKEAMKYLDCFENDNTTKICKLNVSLLMNEKIEKLKEMLQSSKKKEDEHGMQIDDWYIFIENNKLAKSGVKNFNVLWKTSLIQTPTNDHRFGHYFARPSMIDDDVLTFENSVFSVHTGTKISLDMHNGRIVPLNKSFMFESKQMKFVKHARTSEPFLVFNNQNFCIASTVSISNLLVISSCQSVFEYNISEQFFENKKYQNAKTKISHSYYLSTSQKLLIAGSISFDLNELPNLINYSFVLCIDIEKLNQKIVSEKNTKPLLKNFILDICFVPSVDYSFSNNGVLMYKNENRNFLIFWNPKSLNFTLLEDSYLKEEKESSQMIIFKVFPTDVPSKRNIVYDVKGVYIIDYFDFSLTEIDYDFGHSSLHSLNASQFVSNSYAFQTQTNFLVLERQSNSFSLLWEKAVITLIFNFFLIFIFF